MEMFSRTNTQALKGIATIWIFVFHILLEHNITPLLNVWGTFFVTIFLVLSGYGLEESFRNGGLDGYWRKRLDKVVLPSVFFAFAYNYVFSFLFPESAMHRFLDELLYKSATFWFVFFIMKCYAVYWIGTRFMGERLRLFFFVACALINLNMRAPCGNLEAIQSFSFLAGVLLSVNKRRVEALSDREMNRWIVLLFFITAFFYCLKMVPQIHALKWSIAYNYLLCPMYLSGGLAFIPFLTKFHPSRSILLEFAGKYSLEIYLAHIPFIGLIAGGEGTVVFLISSVVCFAILLIYRKFIDGKLSLAEVLFILVNVLFVAKYSERISERVALVATLSAVIFYYILLRLLIPYIFYRKEQRAWSKKVVMGVCLIAFAGMVAVQYAIDPYSIQVDRWSALHFPIQNLLSGIYPYTASTHLGGNASPFPVWQILHIPFYLLGNVGLSFFAATALFLWSCWKVQGREKALVVSLLLCSSVAVWYEVSVRSDLITNLLLLAAII